MRLNKAKEVLLDTEMRRRYDQWIESGLQVSFEDWLSLERRIHPVREWCVSLTCPATLTSSTCSQCTGEEKRSHFHFWTHSRRRTAIRIEVPRMA